jgi:hypothetical protein
MKKLILSISTLFVASIIYAQSCSLDGVAASLTLEKRHWFWAVAKYGDGHDSLSRARIRALRTAILAANPATDATNVTLNNVPGEIITFIYFSYLNNCSAGEYLQMGSTDAERRTIYTNVRGIAQGCIQAYIAVIDANVIALYNGQISKGKSIVFDN